MGYARFSRFFLGFTVLLCALAFLTFAAETRDEPKSWPIGSLASNHPVPDLSFLNHRPAGIHGHVQPKGSDLIFEDGTPALFWGTNLQARSLFRTEPKFIRAHARRIAALGFNLVRIHHHDSIWVKPNIFGDEPANTRQIDPKSIAKLDQWIAALKSEGVYIWLDMHVGRRFTKEDGIEAFDEIAKGEAAVSGKGFNYVSPSIETRMREFQEAYLRHVNPLTGLSYASDPAVVAVQITNENDLTFHFANKLLPDKDVPVLSQKYMALAREFADNHGLNRRATWRAWTYGPSKLFLNDLEHRFNQRMISSVRETGFKGLVSTTSFWGRMPLAGLPSLTDGTIIDAHSYGDEGELGFDPRQRPSMLDWIAIAQVTGRPFSVSEWNVTDFPVSDRFVTPLRIATAAAHQGWDIPVIYGYSQQPLNGPLRGTNWAAAEDPSLMPMLPAAALAFRGRHIKPAKKTFVLCENEDGFFGEEITPETSIAVRTIVEQSRLVVCIPDTETLPWLETSRPDKQDAIILDLDEDMITSDATEILADTGEFRRDFETGRFVLDTPKSQMIAGAFAGEVLSTSAVEVQLNVPLAAVAVQSLDDLQIDRSSRVLISLAARSVPSDPRATTFRIEPMSGTLKLRGSTERTLWGLAHTRVRLDNAHSFDGETHSIDLGKIGAARWLILE